MKFVGQLFNYQQLALSNKLKKPKDKIENRASRGIVYKFKYKDCDCVYFGQISRALKTRMKEHAKAIATRVKNSFLAKHHVLHSHQIDIKSVKIADRSSAWRQRLILEAWHSMRDTNAINAYISLPNIYKNIKNCFSQLLLTFLSSSLSQSLQVPNNFCGQIIYILERELKNLVINVIYEAVEGKKKLNLE